jgi:hypothetical protein
MIIDSIALIEESKNAESEAYQKMLARASIMNSVLLIESVSNSCLFSLKLQGKLLDELDRLPSMSKLDYYLFALKGLHIDRGRREVELVHEILKLRDHVVHPKLKPGRVDGSQDFEVSYGHSNNLQIPNDTRSWDYSLAVNILDVIIDFMCLFFLEWCEMSKGEVTKTLVAREENILWEKIAVWVSLSNRDLDLIDRWAVRLHRVLDVRKIN